jgi:hypothetical protein
VVRGAVITAALHHEERAALRADAALSPPVIKAALAEACAPALIALGGLLTVLWSGTLVLLALRALLARCELLGSAVYGWLLLDL